MTLDTIDWTIIVGFMAVTLAVGLARISAGGAGNGAEELRALLAREIPFCRLLPTSEWNDDWWRALARMIQWIRNAGA